MLPSALPLLLWVFVSSRRLETLPSYTRSDALASRDTRIACGATAIIHTEQATTKNLFGHPLSAITPGGNCCTFALINLLHAIGDRIPGVVRRSWQGARQPQLLLPLPTARWALRPAPDPSLL